MVQNSVSINDLEARQIISKFDLFCIQETHCGPEDLNFSIPGFVFKHFNRPKGANNRYFGGILIIIHEYIQSGTSFVTNKCHDKVWVKLDKQFSAFQRTFISVFYMQAQPHPPTHSPYLLIFLMSLKRTVINIEQWGI